MPWLNIMMEKLITMPSLFFIIKAVQKLASLRIYSAIAPSSVFLAFVSVFPFQCPP
jgi:hypothetical protein